MKETFFDISKEIANDFLQSIVFIDDNAFSDQKGNFHDFDALKISGIFSKDEKICAVYRPKNESDISQFIKIANKADVVILDWQINGIEKAEQSLEITGESDDEIDAEEVDDRGKYTKQIILEVLSSLGVSQYGIKLILVYTGETDLPDIANQIHNFLSENGIDFMNLEKEIDNCGLESGSTVIRVISKSDNKDDSKFNHKPSLKSQIVTYEDLPNYILTQYSKITSGLLSDFALKALTEIRTNSHRILSVFTKDLDSAYLAHQSVLPNVDDANELLIELIKDIIRDLLRHKQLNKFIDKELVDKWTKEKINEIQMPYLNGNGDPLENKKFNRDIKLLNDLLFSKEQNVEERFVNAFKNQQSNDSLSEGKVKTHAKSTIKNALNLFSIAKQDINNTNNKFAILTQHKSLITPLVNEPALSLGTVVINSNNEYFICIQQRCDSVRVNTERRFLFLSMEKVEGNKSFDFISPSGDKLKLNKNSFDIRTVKFKATEDGIIKAKKEAEEYFFYPSYYSINKSEKLKWVFELKELHAQRIVANYCSQLSRVGIDEFEWLRLNH